MGEAPDTAVLGREESDAVSTTQGTREGMTRPFDTGLQDIYLAYARKNKEVNSRHRQTAPTPTDAPRLPLSSYTHSIDQDRSMGTETSLQQQAKALGDPTRHQIFTYIADSDEPVSVAELTSHLGLNHNAIRQHLTKLVEADLVEQSTSRSQGPGRPRLVFRIDPKARGKWVSSSPYQRLSMLLLDLVNSDSDVEDVGRRFGHDFEMRDPASDGERVDVLQEAIALGGFDPEIREHGDTVDFILGTCPFADVASADPDTICGLHLGLAEGLADRLDGVTVEALVRRDPHRAGCRLRCRISPSPTDPDD